VQRPLIGIPPCLDARERWRAGRVYVYADHAYARAIDAAGGLPVHLPMQSSPAELVARIDGLLLPGGDDFAPDRAYPDDVTFDLAPGEQIAFARERARREQLGERVEFIQDDGRNIAGEFDAFVSVGMLEHIGVEGYGELGDVIDRVLNDDGRGLIHSIGRDRPGPLNSWIQRRIFPGAYPPSISEMMVLFEPKGFSVLDIENLRLHYARTLEHWLERYEAQVNTVRNMFDERFVRAWRLYLAGSVSTFHCGELQLFQVLFARNRDNDIPMSRDHIYQQD